MTFRYRPTHDCGHALAHLGCCFAFRVPDRRQHVQNVSGGNLRYQPTPERRDGIFVQRGTPLFGYTGICPPFFMHLDHLIDGFNEPRYWLDRFPGINPFPLPPDGSPAPCRVLLPATPGDRHPIRYPAISRQSAIVVTMTLPADHSNPVLPAGRVRNRLGRRNIGRAS